MSGKNIFLLGAILVVGLALRLSLLAWFSGVTPQIVDENDYIALAKHFAQTGNYATEKEFVSLRPPLYPVMVAKIFQIFGDENFQAVRGIQIIISLLTTILVYGISRQVPEIFSEKGALYATAFFCFYPSIVGMNYLILSETLFTFFLTVVVFLGVYFFRTGSLYAVSFMGVFIALGALTRSVLWLSPFPLVLFIFLFMSGHSIKKRMVAGGLLLLFSMVMITPWAVRNTRVEKTFQVIDCMSGRNLMMGNYEYTPLYHAWSAIQTPKPHDWHTLLVRDFRERNPGESFFKKTQGEKDKLAGRYAIRYICENPGKTFCRDAVKACCFWQLERTFPAGAVRNMFGFERFENNKKLAVIFLSGVIQLSYIFLMFSVILGMFSWHTQNYQNAKTVWIILAFLSCILFYFWGIHSIIFAHERYHLPLIPILSLIAGGFWVNWRENLRVLFSRKKRWIPATVFILSICIFWTVEIFMATKFMF